ncbi:MAG: adenine phosphoribosyltransferase [Kiritimatiellae bacterium]|nr:adenine phosphoribosyltransferase [Kiritimatiellia bacterium]
MKSLESYIRSIPDFPKPGIEFRDVTGILDSADGLRLAIDQLADRLEGVAFDAVVSMESRGFIFGMPLAYKLNKSFVPVRKPGKLPRETVSASYELEYGTDALEMHKDALRPGARVVVVDDLLATGGTAEACARLVDAVGAKVVKMLFVMELEGFAARSSKLAGHDVDALVRYPGK